MSLDRMRLIDLSVPLADQAASEPMPARIHYVDHAGEGLEQMRQFFGVEPADLVYSAGQGWAIEEITAITHTGTHVDAPYHYGAKSEGRPARTIDQVPLEWCFAPGVVIDIRQKEAGELVTVEDLERALARIEYRLRPLRHRAFAHRRRQAPGHAGVFRPARPGTRKHAMARRAGSARDRHRRLHARSTVRRIWSPTFAARGDGRYIWPAHFAGITREYCQIEKLANLDQIPRPHGFYVSCLPVKIERQRRLVPSGGACAGRVNIRIGHRFCAGRMLRRVYHLGDMLYCPLAG